MFFTETSPKENAYPTVVIDRKCISSEASKWITGPETGNVFNPFFPNMGVS